MLSHPTPPQTPTVGSINHVFKCNECYHIPTHPEPQLLRSINHVFKCNKCYHIPPHPEPQLLRSINHVFKCNECYHIPTHPEPQLLRSINHVFKCNECYHIPPHPEPQLLRSINHVFKCNECYHIPPHPDPNCCVASTMCSSATNVITSHPTPPKSFAFGHGVANPAVSQNKQSLYVALSNAEPKVQYAKRNQLHVLQDSSIHFNSWTAESGAIPVCAGYSEARLPLLSTGPRYFAQKSAFTALWEAKRGWSCRCGSNGFRMRLTTWNDELCPHLFSRILPHTNMKYNLTETSKWECRHLWSMRRIDACICQIGWVVVFIPFV